MQMQGSDKTTHFGFQTVAWEEKQEKVTQVFDSVASRYDQMNDLMSFGIHRLWKRIAVFASQVRAGQCVLDLAGGSGDITRLLCHRVGKSGHVILADINSSMLTVARDRLLDAGLTRNLDYVQANAECLPFASNHFDCIMMSFGLRNVTDKLAALKSMYRVCKPGGKLLILEFSSPTLPGLKPLYDAYSFHILPKLGAWFASDAASYRYLAESIRMHPNQTALRQLILDAGFDTCRYANLSGGIVALHTAHKY